MVIIRPMTVHDQEAVLQIYQQGIDTGIATYTTQAPSWDAFDHDHCAVARLVAEDDGVVMGWFALSPHSSRSVYAGVAWESIYIASIARGKGVGKLLMNAGIVASEANGFWTLQAGIFPQNVASLHLHEACGFRVVGVREKLGKLAGVWHDVVLMERRSTVVN